MQRTNNSRLNFLKILAYLIALENDIAYLHLQNKRLRQQNQQLKRQNRKLNYRNNHDHLTWVLNRSAMEKHLRQIAKETVFVTFGSLLLADLDHFKLINDIHGHDTGDRVLRAVGKTLHRHVRPQDKVARWAGDEFLIWLPELDKIQACVVAERLCETITDLRMVIHTNVVLQVRISIGAYFWWVPECSYREAIHYADQAMYQAKRENTRIAVWQG